MIISVINEVKDTGLLCGEKDSQESEVGLWGRLLCSFWKKIQVRNNGPGRVYGTECIGHKFNIAERENASRTIRKHP